MAEQSAGFGWPVGCCGDGRGSGQECGLGGSYWSAEEQEVANPSSQVEVQWDGWSHTVLAWRLDSEL